MFYFCRISVSLIKLKHFKVCKFTICHLQEDIWAHELPFLILHSSLGSCYRLPQPLSQVHAPSTMIDGYRAVCFFLFVGLFVGSVT